MCSLKFLLPVLGLVLSVDKAVCWSGIASCVLLIANDSSIIDPIPTDAPIPQNYTLQTFEAVCNAKEKFIDCVDKSLNTQTDATSSLFKPMFDVHTVTEAYTGLCNNFTGVKDASHFSCLTNTTALMPCYAQFNSYYEYLSVFMRPGSGEGKDVVDSSTRSFLCTLARRRIECEVTVLNRCSVELGSVMEAFYEKSLPTACKQFTDEGKMMPTSL